MILTLHSAGYWNSPAETYADIFVARRVVERMLSLFFKQFVFATVK